MSYTKYKAVNFGVPKSGLATVGYTVNAVRATTGVAEAPAGSGVFGAAVTFPNGYAGPLVWDTGEGTPVYAVESVNPGVDEFTTGPPFAGGAVASVTAPVTLATPFPTLAQIDTQLSGTHGSGAWGGSGGGFTLTQIAGAVWDALLTDHVTAGTFGLTYSLDDSLDSGFARGGTTTTITLRSLAPATLPTPATVSVLAGPGKGQTLAVLSYVGSTKVATVSGTWNTVPDLTTQYAVYSTPASAGGGGGVVTLDPAQTGWTFRDVTAVPDGSLTLSDLLAGGMAAGTGKLVGAAGSTTFTAKTPYSGTLLKTHTLDAAPASGPYSRN